MGTTQADRSLAAVSLRQFTPSRLPLWPLPVRRSPKSAPLDLRSPLVSSGPIRSPPATTSARRWRTSSFSKDLVGCWWPSHLGSFLKKIKTYPS